MNEKEIVAVLRYHEIYAERHKLSAFAVSRSEAFDLAAVLEFQVGTQSLSVSKARRIFVETYPQSNCLSIYKESVINIIKPYEDSIREIQPINDNKEQVYDTTEQSDSCD